MKAVKWLLAAMVCSVSLANAEDWGSGGQHSTSHSLTVLSIKTDEGHTYDYTGSESNPTIPTNFNNIVEYTYRSISTGTGGIVTTNTYTVDADAENYHSLEAIQSSSDQVIQPINKTQQTNNYITPFLTNDTDYVNAGSNGLSLSTGINKTPKYDRDTYLFSLGGFTKTIVGDGRVDFFACDIAYNQSDEEIRILDVNGVMLADVVITKSDWDQHIGWQQVDRVSLDKTEEQGNINAEDFIAPISAIAIEFTDFTLTDDTVGGENVDWDYVAENAAYIEVDIPALTDNNPPKTDYAFLFAVDTDVIKTEAIPEAQSVAYVLVTFTLGMAVRRFFS